MKTKHLEAAAAAVSLLIASGPAQATDTGAQTLGSPSTAMDVFEFTCSDKFRIAVANVTDTTTLINVAHMRVILEKVGQPVVLQAGTIGVTGEATTSEDVRLNGGAGTYRAMFVKTANLAESYTSNLMCSSLTGTPDNPTLARVQNQ